MFSAIRSFLYRHRNKFLIGGSIIGGVALLSRYAEYKIYQLHERETQSCINKQKRRQHYEKTRDTANATVLTLSNTLVTIISEEFDTEAILQAIRSQPNNKHNLWHELKLLGFARCLSSVYSSALVGTFIHVHLMLLGSYTYGDIIEPGHAGAVVSSKVQEDYLSIMQNFVEIGLPSLSKKVLAAIRYYLSPIPLNKQISLEALEAIFKDITLLLAGETIESETEHSSFKLTPWSQYIIEFKKTNSDSHEKCVLNSMTEELLDIIDGEDFNTVMQSLIQLGVNYSLDYVANSYPPPKTVNGLNGSAVNDKSMGGKQEHSSRLEAQDTIISDTFIKSSIPLAKLIPILSGNVVLALSNAPGNLLQSVLLNEGMENLSFNVYEAFSVGL